MEFSCDLWTSNSVYCIVSILKSVKCIVHYLCSVKEVTNTMCPYPQEGIINIGLLLSELCPSEKSIVRKIEKQYYKINATEAAIIFNETCLKEGLL